MSENYETPTRGSWGLLYIIPLILRQNPSIFLSFGLYRWSSSNYATSLDTGNLDLTRVNHLFCKFRKFAVLMQLV